MVVFDEHLAKFFVFFKTPQNAKIGYQYWDVRMALIWTDALQVAQIQDFFQFSKHLDKA